MPEQSDILVAAARLASASSVHLSEATKILDNVANAKLVTAEQLGQMQAKTTHRRGTTAQIVVELVLVLAGATTLTVATPAFLSGVGFAAATLGGVFLLIDCGILTAAWIRARRARRHREMAPADETPRSFRPHW